MTEDQLIQDSLSLAIQAAYMAGKYLITLKDDGVKINSSIGKDIKLEADVASEKIILDHIRAHSSFNILSEEAGELNLSDEKEYMWIVDPLDGSLNYSRGIDIFCISIGLWKNNKPVLGVIYDFINDNLYQGVVGGKAYCNQNEIKVSLITEQKNSIIATGFPVYFNFDSANLNNFVATLQAYKKVRLIGSAAMSLALVAKGSVEIYSEENIAIWDVAAGLAIVEAAGGKIDYKEGKGSVYLNVVATNSKLII